MQTIKCVVVGDGAVGKVGSRAPVLLGLVGRTSGHWDLISPSHPLLSPPLPTDVSPDLLHHKQVPVG